MERNRARRRAFILGGTRNSHIVLSNGAQTAATDLTPTTHFAGRSTSIIEVGAKKVWRITVDHVDITHSVGVGVANVLATFGDDAYLGSQVGEIGYYDTDGSYYINGNPPGTIAAFGTGAVIDIACHGGVGLWFSLDGGATWNNTTADPTTDTGGIDISTLGNVYPAYGLRQAAQITASFTQTLTLSGYTRFPW